MSLSEVSRARDEYSGSGSTGPFTYNFRIVDKAHLEVLKISTTGTVSTLVLDTDYTVAGVGNATGSITLTAALATGETLIILRKQPREQASTYTAEDFPSGRLEKDLDKIVMWVQQADEVFRRVLKFAKASLKEDFDVPDPSGDKVLGWDSTATKLENKTFATETIALIQARGDLITGDAAGKAAKRAVGGADTLPLADGTDWAWTALATVLAAILTTRGDVLVRGATGVVRKALGASGTVLGSDGTDIVDLVRVAETRSIATQHSLTGGGNLSADRTLNLVGDVAAPGANKVYGTDGAGARGWLAAAGDFTKIAETTLADDNSNSILLDNIPGTYRHLLLVIQGRAVDAVTDREVHLRFNGDSAGNYDVQQIRGTATTVDGERLVGQTSMRLGRIAGGNAATGRGGSLVVWVPNYAATTFTKNAISDPISSGNDVPEIHKNAGHWRSTAAITSITIQLNVGNMKAQTRVTLYGLKA